MTGHFQIETDELVSLSAAVTAIADSLTGNPFHQSVSLSSCGSGLVNSTAAESDEHFRLRAIILEADLRACASALDETAATYEAKEAAMSAGDGYGGGGGW